MRPDYQEALQQAKTNKKSIKKKVQKLRKMRKGAVDNIIHPLHEETFEHIDCLQCANCCKTTGPLFTDRDIARISKHLNLKEAEFIAQYLRIDEDQDFVLQQVPCPFLGDDNYCGIYDVRPKACAAYPHTDQVNQIGILALTTKNAAICPAVASIFEKL
ncbi:YkgJ family cysteine cluster protein [bacterium SCSIO 12643]|nr:YkgJ family cysteine cluster protein [bacterium SCSIO 12643]